jgi:cell division protein FtsL
MEGSKKKAEDTRRRTRRQSFLNLVVYLVIAAIAIGLVGYFITCNVRLTELNKELIAKQAELSALQSEEVRLRSEVAGETSAEKVDRFVQANGMSPLNSNQVYYIEAEEEDQVSLPEEDGNWFQQAWNAIVDFLS